MFLEFYVFGESVIRWVGGVGVRNVSSPLRGDIKYLHFMVELWNTLHLPPVHILYDRSLTLIDILEVSPNDTGGKQPICQWKL
jgi:hypothetical protein